MWLLVHDEPFKEHNHSILIVGYGSEVNGTDYG